MAAQEEPNRSPEEEVGESQEAQEPSGPASGVATLGIPDIVVRISIGVIVLGAMTVGVFFLITDILAPTLGPPAPEDISGTASDAALTPAVEPPGDQFLLEDIVLNPAETRGKRFLRLGLSLETRDGPEVLAELETRRAQIKDLIIRKFSVRTLDELSDPVVREEIRLSCIDEINANIASGEISSIYFTDYVLQ